MSMHKLTAGSGYDYLTRQVAALDATEKGHTGLAAAVLAEQNGIRRYGSLCERHTELNRARR
jgi:hypothetical protein